MEPPNSEFAQPPRRKYHLGTAVLVLAYGQLSGISVSLHELHHDATAAQGPDRPFAPLIAFASYVR